MVCGHLQLRVKDVDFSRGETLVRHGKGGKDRYTLLSETCIDVLREYWKKYRPKHPEGWLFLGTYNVSHITSDGIDYAFNKAAKMAGITKDVSIHSLRHYATRLFENETRHCNFILKTRPAIQAMRIRK